MQITLNYDQIRQFHAISEEGAITHFDGHLADGGLGKSPTPMEHLLASVAACSAFDVVSILEKKRKSITKFSVDANGERRDEHPRIFTTTHLHYKLTSPDATIQDLERCIELSHEKYCGASAMFRLAGVKITHSAEIVVA